MLGGAKRVSMANLFKAAAGRRDVELRLFSYELSLHTPVSCVATIVKGEKWSSPDIYKDLLYTIDRHEIDMIVPFVDPAIGIAARVREMEPRIYVPTGSVVTADVMLDKKQSDEAFRRAGIPVPRGIADNAPYPLIAKPRYGSASQGIVVIRSADRLRHLDRPEEEYLIQEYIADREEYTVDCFVDRSGTVTACQPRLRVATAGGEVTETVTVDSPEIIRASRNALTRLGLRGAVTLQWLRDRHDGRLLIMEVNARLGGGAVVSVYAGSDIPGMMLDDAMTGRGGAPAEAVAGVRMTRYMQEVIFYE